jgi:nucleoside-diphosphate-sugar epimerase
MLRMSRCFPEPADLMGVYRLHRGVDARDVAAAHAAALSDADGPHRTWVISGATPFRREDVAMLARDAPPVLRERAPALVAAHEQRGWALPTIIDRVYDSSHAMRELRWLPTRGFESVLGQLDEESVEVLPPLTAPPRRRPLPG